VTRWQPSRTEKEYAELAQRRVRAAERGSVLRDIAEAYPLS
jgi:hypothetical protein